MPVVPADLEECHHGGEKPHQEGSRTADAPSGVIGIDHGEGGNGLAQFLPGGVNGPVRLTEGPSGLGQGALTQPDASLTCLWKKGPGHAWRPAVVPSHWHFPPQEFHAPQQLPDLRHQFRHGKRIQLIDSMGHGCEGILRTSEISFAANQLRFRN